MGVNQFSDLSIEEFTDLYHKDGLAMPTEEARKPLRHPSLQAAKKHNDKPEGLPDKVDWREAGKVTTPQDQSSCGSCWAFTTATTMESLHAIENKTSPIKMSVQ